LIALRLTMIAPYFLNDPAFKFARALHFAVADIE